MTEPSRDPVSAEPSAVVPDTGVDADRANRRGPKRVVPDTEAIERSSRRVLRVGRLAMIAVTVVLLALLGRVYQLQSSPSPRIAAMVDSQTSTRELNARRGSLVDRRQRVLATTRVAHLLFIDPDIVENPNTFSEIVGHSLGYDPAWIEQQLFKRRGSRYIVIDKQMPPETYELYRSSPELRSLRGLSSHPILVRDYPKQQLAGQIVGFIGHEGNGLDGLERAYNDRLAPDPGQHAFVYDRGRNRLWLANQDYKLQADGKPIRLSIDLNLQTIAEEELAATVEKFDGESGQLIVMDPRTGEILALANYPFFNPARLRNEQGQITEATRDAQRNRAVTDVFEPGSILKPLVWAASIEAGFATPDELIDTTDDGMYRPQRGPMLKDSSYGPGKGHGVVSYEEVLVQSSNIGMAVVAERMGMDALHKILDSYGFGRTTGSQLPGEVRGMFRPVSRWSYTDLTRMPMGHGIAVTPLQAIRAFAALANDGVLINPTIETAAEQTDEERRTNITARVLSPRVAQHVREVLGRVVTEGTGRRAQSELYDLFGKTGTAELPDLENGGYHKNLYSSSFIAGAPIDQPRLVVGCFVHRTTKRIVDGQYTHYGGVVSGPAVKRVMERSLTYLGVPTKSPELQTADAVAQSAP